MLNQKFFITTILVLLLSSQLITASTQIQAHKPSMSIVEAAQYLNDLMLKLIEGRSQLGARRFLTRFDEQKKPDIGQLTDAIATVQKGVDVFGDHFGDFFEAEKIKSSLKYLNDNSVDFFNTDQQKTSDSMNNLGWGLQTMNEIKIRVTNMLTGIEGGVSSVEGVYAKWEKAKDKLDKLQQDKVLINTVMSLDKTMLGALTICGEVAALLTKVASNMTEAATSFKGLSAMFEEAKTNPKSQPQVNYFSAWTGKVAAHCKMECLSVVFTLFMSSSVCLGCLGAELVYATKEESERVEKMIAENLVRMNDFKAAMDSLTGLSNLVHNVAMKEFQSVTTFATKLRTMEGSLKLSLDIAKDD